MKKWNSERVVKGEPGKDVEGAADPQMDAALEVIRAALEKREPKVASRVLKKEAKAGENQ